jgi:hypothetical protein
MSLIVWPWVWKNYIQRKKYTVTNANESYFVEILYFTNIFMLSVLSVSLKHEEMILNSIILVLDCLLADGFLQYIFYISYTKFKIFK